MGRTGLLNDTPSGMKEQGGILKMEVNLFLTINVMWYGRDRLSKVGSYDEIKRFVSLRILTLNFFGFSYIKSYTHLYVTTTTMSTTFLPRSSLRLTSLRPNRYDTSPPLLSIFSDSFSVVSPLFFS